MAKEKFIKEEKSLTLEEFSSQTLEEFEEKLKNGKATWEEMSMFLEVIGDALKDNSEKQKTDNIDKSDKDYSQEGR